MTLREEILLDKLQSDLLIYEAKLAKETMYIYNQQQQVSASVTNGIIDSIKKQIKQLKASSK